jgi:glucose/arabinose dehydrogenase
VKRVILLGVLALGSVVMLGLGTGAALCKLRYDCGIMGPSNDAEADAALLAERLTDAATLPGGYREEVILDGLVLPTDFAFLPDGDILVAEKGGRIVKFDPRTAASHVVLDLTDRVDSRLFRGLLTVAVDPEFVRNRLFYLVYTPKPSATEQGETPTVTRVSRFSLGAERADEAGETVIVGTVTVPTCSDLPATSDCLPSDRDHNGAQLAFAADGTIFLATGDGGGYDDQIEETALRVQNLDSLAGKVLRITRDGKGLASNPFWNGNPSANRSKVWSLGFRNPFRLALADGSMTPIVGDVGRATAEEIDAAARGANLGWPCYEGRVKSEVYESTALCKAMYRRPAAVDPPLVTIDHPDGNSITGGDFAPAAFPLAVRGQYLFADWRAGWLRYVRIDGARRVGPVRQLATGLPGPTAFHASEDGAIYYAALNAGQLRRIGFVG